MIDVGECFRLNIAMVFLAAPSCDGLPVVMDFECGCENWPATERYDGAEYTFACRPAHAWFPGQRIASHRGAGAEAAAAALAVRLQSAASGLAAKG